MTLPASKRFGFLRADIAFLSSASTMAFFLALASSALVKLELLECISCGTCFSFEPPVADDWSSWSESTASFNDLLSLKDLDSLDSRLSPGTCATVACRRCARASHGPLETLRRSLSLESTRSKLRAEDFEVADFPVPVLLVTAPGLLLILVFVLAEETGFSRFSFLGDCFTGPPSLRFKLSQISGNRAEKLGEHEWSAAEPTTHTEKNASLTHNGTMISVQKSLKGLSDTSASSSCVCDSARAFTSSRVIDSQMHKRSACTSSSTG